MLYIATKRELLEGLIVAELIAKPGQGPLARRHFPTGGRGPASGLRSTADRAKAALAARADGVPETAPRSDEPPPAPRPTPGDEEPR